MSRYNSLGFARFYLMNIILLCLLSEFGRCYGDVQEKLSKEEEWTELLGWYRTLNKSSNLMNDYFLTEGFQRDESLGIDFDSPNDEANFSDGFYLNDAESVWNSLIGGTRTLRTDPIDFHDEEKPVSGASLAFVFDSTGSMGDELNQVKAGAMKILSALRDHPDVPIANYIWVPFNDPGIGPITVTSDPNLFEKRMNDVIASGGGDCPEMALGAIKKALQASLLNSYIYVFTDAAAKDVDLLNEVLSLVQRKQAQVVFIITNGCLDTEDTYYWVYERIAEASSGQIYKLTTNEVKEVLKYVKVALQPHIVSLLSLNKPAPDKQSPDKVEVVVDDSLRQFTVSVSGLNAWIDVADPKGIHVWGPPRLENVLNLTNIKVVNVNEPDPGAWSVVVKSDSNYTIRSTGLSKINFNHGFSTVETTNLLETNYRPLKGAKSFILIQTSDSDQVYNITNVDFVDMTGNVIESHKLLKVEGNPGLYRATGFIPPQDFFYLGVTGFGQDGLPIKRITSTAISAQLPEKPIVSMKTKMVGKINERGLIGCRVESVTPVTVTWFKNKKMLGKEHNCSETCETIFHIDRYSLQTEGNYTCRAQNVAGIDEKVIRVFVIGKPPSVEVNSPVVASPGQKVVLNCSVRSEIPYTVTWTQFTATNQHTGVLHPSFTGVKLKNNSLLIDQVKTEDEGWYVCIAKNTAGESQGRVLLVVKEPVTVKVTPLSFSFTKGNSVRLTCSATGKPRPQIEWLKNQQTIKDPSILVEEIGDNVNLVFDYLEKRHAGIYNCNAGNLEEFASANAELIYKETPTVKAEEKSVMVRDGSKGILKCTASGIPQPTIKWYKDGRELSDDETFQINNDSLIIKSVDASDFGEYSCVAINSEGSSVDHIALTVGSAPTFLQKPRTREIRLKHTATISCSAFGVPLPEVKWRRANGQDIDATRMTVLPTGALKINRVRYNDRGRYTCTAENVFGSVSHDVEIKVLGAVKPVLDDAITTTEVKALSGRDLLIPCGISLGNPPAKVKWFKDDVELPPGDRFIVKTSGELTIRNATLESKGTYLCLAENVVGNSSRSFDITVSESPKIIPSNEEEVKGTIGGEIVVKCPVGGVPPPTITWMKNGKPLSMASTFFQDENGSLIIKNLTINDAGIYTCTATNSVGSASKEIAFQVQVPPSFTDDVQDLPVSVVEGHAVVLNCNATGIPEPVVHWLKDEKPFSGATGQPKILRFFATTEHTGFFKCIVTNEAGNETREFNVSILVPPKILDNHDQKSIKSKTGLPFSLTCNVTGTPAPTILWQRNGMYLTQNTTDILISDEGTLTILNVTKESAGSYTCDAENLGGITQRNYYLQVNYPPTITEVENIARNITILEGSEYSLVCLVEGNPKPAVLWKKNGFPITNQLTDLTILDDNTLVFLQANREMSGIYRCEASNTEGSTFTEYEISVRAPPSLTSDIHPTRLEVNEGDSLSLICPTALSGPPPIIHWSKDGKQLDPLLPERSDEAQMKLSLDGRTLTIMEAHPSDRGNYSCVATKAGGRTDAKFFVDVLMTPHFEEFNHVAHRTILTGGEVILNCSVSGNPRPRVMWRKGNTSITPHNMPGVQVTLDKKHLKIVNGRIDHTGTYICLATNKVNTKEREFYVTVLEPPQINGALQERIQILKGDKVTLNCESTGSPSPTYLWIKKDNYKTILNYTGSALTIHNAVCEDSGLYLCEITNAAGKRTKFFDVQILESPKIENQDVVDEINGVVGGNVTLKCKTSGHPRPETTWFHNGRILNRYKRSEPMEKSDNRSEEYVALELTNVKNNDAGVYTLLAFNSAGVVEKKFKIKILVPPTLLPGHKNSEMVSVIELSPVVLKCPVQGEPTPLIIWFFGNESEENLHDSRGIKITGNELRIMQANVQHSGLYLCLAENSGGHVKYSFNVSVIQPPKTQEKSHPVPIKVNVNDTVQLYCDITEAPNTDFSWYHSSVSVPQDSKFLIRAGGKALVINRVQWDDLGEYKCVASNAAGSAEIQFDVDIQDFSKFNEVSRSARHIVVRNNHPFALHCLITGELTHQVIWYKNGRIIDSDKKDGSLVFRDTYLKFPAARPEDAGYYKCSTKTDGTGGEMKFKVDVVGKWSEWSDWSPCTSSCGRGEQLRRRTCQSQTAHIGKKLKFDCVGVNINKKICFNKCETWGEWSTCSQTCGKGITRRCKVTMRELTSNANMDHKNSDNCEEKICIEKECPVDGQWSNWSEWSSCTQSFGLRMRQRLRKCDSPPAQEGGKQCLGPEYEKQRCEEIKCLEPGDWLEWSDWSSCSQTCGRGSRRRSRRCRPSKCGRLCMGSNIEEETCFLRECTNIRFPSSANLRLKGSLNGHHIRKRITAEIETSKGERQITTKMDSEVQPDEWFPYMPFVMSPLSWNTAYEMDSADNGYSLTNGNFYSESDVKFSTGEGLRVKHKGEGVDENGSFLVEIEVVGEVPLVEPHATVLVEPIEQDFVQAGPKTLYSFTQNNVTIANSNLSYTWNNSITYDGHRGAMPYLVEKLTMKNISNVYDQKSRNVSFTVSSSIGKKFTENKCPPGFAHNVRYMHCEDVDECDGDETPCERDKICRNSFGSFSCICRPGFKMAESRCLDIDECSQTYDICSHFCHNTPGSFICSCPYGYYMNQDRRHCVEISENDEDTPHNDEMDATQNYWPSKEWSSVFDGYQEHKAVKKESCPPGYFLKQKECKDYDECENFPNICDADETCVNIPGSFQCISTPCPTGYTRMQPNNHCVKICTAKAQCTRGAMVSESLIYYPATLNATNILSLDKIGQPSCSVVKTRYKVVEPTKLFQVKTSNGRHFLQPSAKINRKTLYRVRVEAFSYAPKNELLYFSELLIFFILN
ncbi:hypothetical protein RUM43_010518 [Polyplax serrata]|uniref:Uncharacterized protein n=1 Tax=Polyplax serrata TaxID=468196 RepID=A0AAN8P7F4_POLSC